MNLLLADLDRKIAELPSSQLPNLIGALSIMTAKAQLRMLHTDSVSTPLPDAGHYLNVEDVTARFKVSKAWLYRHKRTLPHHKPSRKILLFPERAIATWFASRKGA